MSQHEDEPRRIGQNEDGILSKLELRVLRACRVFLMGTAPVALLLGVISVALKPIEPKPWADFCVALGIALLVYAAIALVVLILAGQCSGRTKSTRKSNGQNLGMGGGGDQKTDQSPAADWKPDWKTIIAFVGKLFGALLFLGFVGVALLVSGLAAPLPFWHDFGRLAGTGLLVALGFFAAGTLFGFLFGLPRSPRPQPDATDQPKQPKNQDESLDQAIPGDNTNLEEISDWLTKIIIGLGLVELKEIPTQFMRLANFFKNTCGSEFCGGIFLMMGIFFFIIGFISSYVLARVYLKLALYLTGKLLEPDLTKLAKETDTNRAISLANEARVEIRKADSDALKDKPGSESTLRQALQLIGEALKYDPSYYVAYTEKGRALRRLAKLEGEDKSLLEQALEAVMQARKLNPTNYPAVYNSACYKSLLRRPVEEVLADLKVAFSLNPSLKEIAKQDPDLEWVRTSSVQEFNALASS